MRARIVTGLVIAAGSSRRLGAPKQLLAYRGATLLDATLDMARAAAFDQRILTLGANAVEIRQSVDTAGFVVVDSTHYADGCSSSITSALASVDPEADGIVLLLGDQPGVSIETIEQLVDEAGNSPLAVCAYADGVGHPFWFGRAVFGDLSRLHGDKGVWKIIESGDHDVIEVPIDGSQPPDVDTWEDYTKLVESEAATS